jgi:hypothetical protein
MASTPLPSGNRKLVRTRGGSGPGTTKVIISSSVESRGWLAGPDFDPSGFDAGKDLAPSANWGKPRYRPQLGR